MQDDGDFTEGAEEDYIVEFISLGESVKVTIMDPNNLREVSIVGPARAPRQNLIDIAIRKLRYVLGKDKKA